MLKFILLLVDIKNNYYLYTIIIKQIEIMKAQIKKKIKQRIRRNNLQCYFNSNL